MRNLVIPAFISLGLVTSLHAGTALNCTNTSGMKASWIEACANQTNDWLNDNYQQLLAQQSSSAQQVKLLKATQQTWAKRVESQCKTTAKNTASNDTLASLKCEIALTHQRATELEKMATY